MSAAEVEREATTTIPLGVRPLVDGHTNLDSLIASLDQENKIVVDQVIAATEPVALLLVLKGPGRGNRFMIDAQGAHIGRNPSCDVFLDDITVSRKHAEISFTENFIFADSGSLNGSYLNNDRITSASLTSGDEIQIGKFRFIFISNKN